MRIGLNCAWAVNLKRMHEEFQHLSLESIRRDRAHMEKVLSDAQSISAEIREIANQAHINEVQTANLLAKQAMRHVDFAVKKQAEKKKKREEREN
ncbi:MAG: hypothetical protein BBJ57_02125 [Desulfobacterales bacterium PC51MH44]|nr:MAG: hypothetical protein BBJ57_02125 [Desulfobacterales bacterium PC51MH44]